LRGAPERWYVASFAPAGAREERDCMLVLTRKSNQSIMIGDEIEISVLSIMGEKVRIGIQAPRDIPVFRKEVYLEIQREGADNAAAAAVPAPAETPTTPA
jgi:carbon storage regulator